MKVSATPTNIIAVAARNNSEWDNIDFALINLNEKYIGLLNLRIEAMKLVKDCPDLAGLRFWDCPNSWHVHSDETEELREVLEQKEWCYVDVAEEEIETFATAEQRIDGETMRLHGDMSFCFVGYGKHTSEEFWTSDVPLQEVITNFTNTHQLAAA